MGPAGTTCWIRNTALGAPRPAAGAGGKQPGGPDSRVGRAAMQTETARDPEAGGHQSIDQLKTITASQARIIAFPQRLVSFAEGCRKTICHVRSQPCRRASDFCLALSARISNAYTILLSSEAWTRPRPSSPARVRSPGYLATALGARNRGALRDLLHPPLAGHRLLHLGLLVHPHSRG